METEVPPIVERTLDEESVVDVSDEYPDTISMFVELAEARSDPIPLQHVLAYKNTESSPEHVIFQFVVDTDEEYLDETFAFEMAIGNDVATEFESEDEQDTTQHEMAIKQFNSSIRSAREAIWGTVLNDPYER